MTENKALEVDLSRRDERNEIFRMKNPVEFIVIQRFVGPQPLENAVVVSSGRATHGLDNSEFF